MVTMDDIKTPPQNLEAEKGVLAWALMDNETIWIYDADKLEPADFYQKEHQAIYSAIKKLWGDRKTIDVVTVWDFEEYFKSFSMNYWRCVQARWYGFNYGINWEKNIWFNSKSDLRGNRVNLWYFEF